jgi:serine-type D-Ala-D-Ala carboxypeptidase (penicillin-binding protein 5/6)
VTGGGRLLAALLAAAALPLPGASRTAAGSAADLEPPSTLGPAVPPAGWPEPPSVSASGAILVEAGTGQVLAAVDPDTARPPASAVKILTVLSALRRTDLDDAVVVPDGLGDIPLRGATAGVRPGETWQVRSLLETAIALSANDAAFALALLVGGSADGFVALMRADAEAVGVEGAVASPDGFGDDMLSPRDLAAVTRAALEDDRFAAIAQAPTVDVPGRGTVESLNRLLVDYHGADGVKTGHTLRAGRTLVASATRDGRRLVAVVLGSADPDGHFADASALLDHGFEAFSRLPALEGAVAEFRRPGQWSTAVIESSRPLVPVGTEDEVEIVVHPAADASEAGFVRVTWDGVPMGDVPLSVERDQRRLNGGAAIGAWWADRGYTALRATVAGPGAGS